MAAVVLPYDLRRFFALHDRIKAMKRLQDLEGGWLVRQLFRLVLRIYHVLRVGCREAGVPPARSYPILNPIYSAAWTLLLTPARLARQPRVEEDDPDEDIE